jgi:hypothetical protein
MRMRFGRKATGVLAAAVVVAVLLVGVALAVNFTQRTEINPLSAARVGDMKHVLVKGKLTATHHRTFCVSGRRIKIVETATGVTKRVKTKSTGRFRARFMLPKTEGSDFVATFAGRVSGTHPSRHVCTGSHRKVHVNPVT